MPLLLNCDLGEIEDAAHRAERALMPLIDLANIACGLHAGSPLKMQHTLVIAKECGVTVGAHPGYGDRANFGRLSIPHTEAELTALLQFQIAALEGMAHSQGLAVSYVKPHGALYNDMMANPAIFHSVLKVLGQQREPKQLMLLATTEADHHRDIAATYGIELIFETFADRRYGDDGFLSPRQMPGAVLDHQAMLEQVQQLCEDGAVTTIGGHRLAIQADSLCIHGDTPDALTAVAAIRALLGKSS